MLSASLPSAQHSFGAIHGTNKLTDEGNLPAKNKCLRLSACSHYDLQLLACSAAAEAVVGLALSNAVAHHTFSFPCADLT